MVDAGPRTAGAEALAGALRLPVFAAVTTGLALAAHGAGGGSLPGLGYVALLAGVVALAGSRFTGREYSYRRLLVLVAVTQFGLHLALLDPHDRSHEGHHAAAPGSMLVAHVVAALLATWWMRRGEAAAWRALRRVLPARRALNPIPLIVPARAVLVTLPPLPCPGSLLLSGLPRRRGPPPA